METVESYEEKGRDIFINKVIPVLIQSGYTITNVKQTKLSERWDVQYDQEKDDIEKEIFVEIKYRNIPSTKYEDSMIDLSKYNYLLEKHSKATKRTEIVFCSIFTDGLALFWNLVKDKDIRFDIAYTEKMTVGPSTTKQKSNKVYFKNNKAWTCKY